MSSGSGPKVFGDRVKSFLLERYPSKTAAHVAADTGCKMPTVEKWLSGVSAPGGYAVTRLIAAYGPEFLAAIIEPPAWLERIRDEIQEDTLREAALRAQQRLEAFYSSK